MREKKGRVEEKLRGLSLKLRWDNIPYSMTFANVPSINILYLSSTPHTYPLSTNHAKHLLLLGHTPMNNLSLLFCFVLLQNGNSADTTLLSHFFIFFLYIRIHLRFHFL